MQKSDITVVLRSTAITIGYSTVFNIDLSMKTELGTGQNEQKK
jgi:hypothetical protein